LWIFYHPVGFVEALVFCLAGKTGLHSPSRICSLPV
jgi:hypothetical protein